MTSERPLAPDVVRYAVAQGVVFVISSFRAHAEVIDNTPGVDIAMGLIAINNENVLRVLNGTYYAETFKGCHATH
jgi:hypothetical protein